MQTNDIWFKKVGSLGGVLDLFASILTSSMFGILTVLYCKKKSVQEEAELISSGTDDILNSISFTDDCRNRS